MFDVKQERVSISITEATQESFRARRRTTAPYKILVAMLSIVLFLDITLRSHGFWFLSACLQHLRQWSALPAVSPLDPGQATSAFSGAAALLTPVNTPGEAVLCSGAFVLLLLLYFIALRYLPQYITYRFLFLSTALLGLVYLFIPVITSQDIFSYISYAHMAVLYHLNPLTTLPTAIRGDAVYPYLYWVNQPSIYGPTWMFISGALQCLALILGFKSILFMEMLLRFFELSMHLGSVHLVWLMSRHLQRKDASSPLPLWSMQRRLLATLAFAWNPFLLFEAAVNAHNDTTILFLVLLALWFLLRWQQGMEQGYLLAVTSLALAACLKITLVVLLPGLLLFLWTQQVVPVQRGERARLLLAATGLYAAIIILLYAPFWQQGALLHLFQVTPGMSRDINSVYEALIRIYAQARGITLPANLASGSHIEIISHQISLCLFAMIYGWLCLRSLRSRQYIDTLPALIRWMALAWLLYCIVGSPWFWPWYTIVFFGLVALIEVSGEEDARGHTIFGDFRLSLFTRVLVIVMLGADSAGSGGMYINFYPSLLHFSSLLLYLRGLYIWIAPFVVLFLFRLLSLRRNDGRERKRLIVLGHRLLLLFKKFARTRLSATTFDLSHSSEPDL